MVVLMVILLTKCLDTRRCTPLWIQLETEPHKLLASEDLTCLQRRSRERCIRSHDHARSQHEQLDPLTKEP